MLRGNRGEVILERDGRGVDELHGDQRGPENRRPGPGGQIEESGGQGQGAGHHDAGNFLREEGSDPLGTLGGGKSLEITQFRMPDDLDALGGEVAEKARDRETGAVDGRLGDATVHSLRIPHQLHAEGLTVIGKESTDRQGIFPGRGRFLGGLPGHRVTWRRIRPGKACG